MAGTVVGGEVDADMALMDSGLDSLGAVELSELLQKAAGGATLPGTLIFDQPTARRLTNYLAVRMTEQEGGHGATFVAANKKAAGDVLIPRVDDTDAGRCTLSKGCLANAG